MGRTLTNAMVNMGIDSGVEEGLYEVHTHTHNNIIHIVYFSPVFMLRTCLYWSLLMFAHNIIINCAEL